MRRGYMIPCLLAAGIQCVAAQTLLMPMASVRPAAPAAAVADEVITLLTEDFSAMSAGSEAAPDATNIADKRTGAISADYTAMPGWSGAAVYQAGGTCAVLKGKFSDGVGGFTEETGFLRTPQGAYAGKLTLSFRARLLHDATVTDKMDVALLNSSGRLESRSVDVTNSWQSFTLNFTKGEFTGCLLQLAMLNEEVLIDDIKVTTVQTSIPAPVALEATEYVHDGFTASWQPVAAADRYLLTVYEKLVDEAVTLVDFEDINVIAGSHKLDKTNPGFPEGWTIAYGTTRNADHFSDNGCEGTKGMIFRATGEGFETPVFDRDIRDFSFWASHPSGEGCVSNLVVSVCIGGQWSALGNYAIERITQQGGVINLSSNLPEGTRALQVAIKKNDQNDAGKDISIVVDNIRIMTDPEGVAVHKDIATDRCSYAVAGLDPEKDYSYTVKAANADFVSSESNEITAKGIAAPELAEATGLGESSYTANWKAMPKADGYMVSNYRVYTTQKAGEEVTVLYENFDKVTSGSLENPVGLYNVVNPLSLDAYTINPGWLGLATYLANGMLGTRAYMGIVGMIQTPALDLSADGGRFTVRLRITGDTDAVNESVVVQAGAANYVAKPIEAGKPVECVYEFDCGEAQMPLAVYSQNGFPFYIDEMTVTQTMPAGAKVFYPLENRAIADGGVLSAKFDNLEYGKNEQFAYRVFAYRNFMGARQYSTSGSAQFVDLAAAGIEDPVTDPDEELTATYYTVDGIVLDGKPSAPGFYVRRTSDGKASVVRL